ncbi:MAG: ribulose-phosphate 3-epimerase, partial [Anaerolineae bacterium]|nr:ribulose-phosphate 3-epimerase [Anaerolineae bacterium]
HIEASPHLHRTLQQIHEVGCKAGVAINPHTPARDLSTVLHMIDIVNVMTVNPGFGGQEFIPESTEKIQLLRTMILQAQRPIFIEVDGGINSVTARRAVAAGADVLIAGTAVFGHTDGVAGGIAALRAALP